MKIITFAIRGHTRLGACIAKDLHEMGHRTLLVNNGKASLGAATTDGGVMGGEHGTSVREVEWHISCGGQASMRCPEPRTLELHVTRATDDESSAHVEWWSCLEPGNAVVLEAERISCQGRPSGADRKEAIEQRARALMLRICRRLSMGLDDMSAQRAGHEDCAARLDLDKLQWWHPSNDNNRSFETEASLPEMIQRAAEAYPDGTAVIDAWGSVSYACLLRAAARVERRILATLRSVNVSSHPMIGVMFPKSRELYIAIVAVLRAGSVYVPIDPTFPMERVSAILKEAGVHLLIADIDPGIGIRGDIPVLTMQGEGDDCEVVQNPCVLLSNHDRAARGAVAIFTSGSSGKAKGVMLSHENILHFSYWYREHVQLDRAARVLQFATIAFDASLLDIFPTWLSGAALVAPTEDQRHDFDSLRDLVDREQITHAFLPPALLAALPAVDWPSLRHIVTGGDVCDPETIDRWSKGRTLHNIYGPTECTVLATTSVMVSGDDRWKIGRPIPNVKCYVLDEEQRPVCTGRPGELYIGGAGVGLGYVGAPSPDGSRFLTDPSSDKPHAIVFRTGDTVQWEPSGELSFIGRMDDQVKIRGFRVEPAEVEAAILELGQFGRAAVVVDSRKRLIAFVSRPRRSDVSGDSIRIAVAQRLPEYMVPRRVIVLEELPSTTNGKLDRSELRRLASESADNRITLDVVFSPAESTLRRMWAELLDTSIDEIGKDSSFFDLGGHSLLISRMMLAVKREFTGTAPLARFMERPTISGLARLLTDGKLKKGDQIVPQILKDLQLPPDVAPGRQHRPGGDNRRNVLVTGATGFLGAAMVHELLIHTDATLYCVVRAASVDAAYKRLKQSLGPQGGTDLCENARLRIVLGDLSEKGIGLSAHDYLYLSEAIDTIYHCGANVNHVYDYDRLYKENVLSTLELLRFAVNGRKKSLHFISTLSAASSVDAEGRVTETRPALTAPVYVNNGYNLTKWVSEHLVAQAADREVDTTIVRPGNIVGRSDTGMCVPQRNRILLLLKGCIQLGYAPASEMTFDLSPVDFVARATVACTMESRGCPRVLHLQNPSTLTWNGYLLALVARGYRLTLEPAERWRRRLLSIDESNALFDVLAFYLDDMQEDIGDMSLIESVRTAEFLQSVGVSYPAVDAALLDRHFGYLAECGFLPQP